MSSGLRVVGIFCVAASLTIISGSQRADSQSLKAAHYLSTLAEADFTDIDILDLHQINLPLWNEGVWTGSDEWAPWRKIATQLQNSDAFVFITPEWHGMATPALKNFLMLSTAKEMAHKPALVVSVSASVNGVYPISELRLTGSKNNHVCLIPDHLIFRNVESLFNPDGSVNDVNFHGRGEYTMKLLSAYAHALKPVHRDMVEAGKPFQYGM